MNMLSPATCSSLHKERNRATTPKAKNSTHNAIKPNTINTLNNKFRASRRKKSLPHCNTGGYGFSDKTNNQPLLSLTKIDWLRSTNTNLESFKSTMRKIDGNGGLLSKAGIEVRWTEKGLHGYEQSAQLLLRKGNDDLHLGHLALSEQGRNKGGLLELTGAGCKLFQLQHPKLWQKLHSLLVNFKWRVSRVDIALDLHGDYCIEKGYTVPSLFDLAVNNQLFQSDKLRNPNMKQVFNTSGDWSSLVTSTITPASYDPIKHSKAGLTAYIGSRKSSADFFRIYEKGKELLGAEAEPDSTERAWIRIEHEMTRKGTGREIPLDTMLRPDEYFAINRAGARELMHELRASLSMQEVQHVQITHYKRETSLSLSRKVHWAKHSYGRLFRTLIQRGIDYEQIINWLSRSDGLKEFIFDFEELAA